MHDLILHGFAFICCILFDIICLFNFKRECFQIYLFWLISKVKYLYFGMTIAFYCIAIILAFKMALVVKSVSCDPPILLCIYTNQFLYCIYYTIKEIQVVESDWNDIIYYFLNEIVEVYTGQKIVLDILNIMFSYYMCR